MGRLEKLEKAAREAGVLSDDESAERIANALWGLPYEKAAKQTMKGMLNPFALIATRERLYGVRLGQRGLSRVKEQLFELPIQEASVTKKGHDLVVGRFGEPFWLFKLPQYRSGART